MLAGTPRIVDAGGGGGGGGMVIGDPVVGGSPNVVLFLDDSGNLSQNVNYTYKDPTIISGAYIRGGDFSYASFPVEGFLSHFTDPTDTLFDFVSGAITNGSTVNQAIFGRVDPLDIGNGAGERLVALPGTIALRANDAATYDSIFIASNVEVTGTYTDTVNLITTGFVGRVTDAVLKYEDQVNGILNQAIMGSSGSVLQQSSTLSNTQGGFYASNNQTVSVFDDLTTGHIATITQDVGGILLDYVAFAPDVSNYISVNQNNLLHRFEDLNAGTYTQFTSNGSDFTIRADDNAGILGSLDVGFGIIELKLDDSNAGTHSGVQIDPSYAKIEYVTATTSSFHNTSSNSTTSGYTDGTILTEIDLGSSAKSALRYVSGTSTARTYVSGDRVQSEFFDSATTWIPYVIQNAFKSELGVEDSADGLSSYVTADQGKVELKRINPLSGFTNTLTVDDTGVTAQYDDGTVISSAFFEGSDFVIKWTDTTNLSQIYGDATQLTNSWTNGSDTSFIQAGANGAEVSASNGVQAALVRYLAGGVMQSQGRVPGTKGADLASTANLVLGYDGTYFGINGTTTIETIDGTDWQNGQTVILKASANFILKDNGTGTGLIMFLAGSTDFAMNPDDTITLVKDGSVWIEVARMER